MPDVYALKGFQPEKAHVLEGNQTYPWEVKEPLLFFRGKDSGIFREAKWAQYPRPKLMALSTQYPDLIDAKFTGLFHKEYHQLVIQSGFMGNFVSMKEHPHYKYLMDLDGNCAPTPRFPLLLHSNSVILKNMTDSILWFYSAIKPYTHFIPVEENLGDLLVQIEWAKTHDTECQQISENARNLATEILTQEMAYLYFYRLLEAYAEKQKEEKLRIK